MDSVSVVIPCHNGAPFLKETLESVWQQTHAPLEVIVVDNGSTDASAAIAENHVPSVRVLSQEDRGISGGRNRGIEVAQGDWIAFVDADDLWKPTKLEQQIECVKHQQNAVCVHTGYEVFGLRNFQPELYEAVRNSDYSVESLLLDPIVFISTAMVRRDLQMRFPEWARHGEDYIFFTELARQGRFLYVPESLVRYRSHQTQLHRQLSHFAANFRNRLAWVDRNTSSLGQERAGTIKTLLQERLIQETTGAFWIRDWKKYWMLRSFACTLDWPGNPPEILTKKIYPPVAYALKDAFDHLRSRPQRTEF